MYTTPSSRRPEFVYCVGADTKVSHTQPTRRGYGEPVRASYEPRYPCESTQFIWLTGTPARWINLRPGAPGDRQGVKGASPSQQRCSEPCCPRVMCGASRGAVRSVDRGTCRPAIEPRKRFDPGADAFRPAEGNTHGRVIASAHATRRGRRPWHARTLFAREPGDLQSDRRRLWWLAVRIGKVRSRRR